MKINLFAFKTIAILAVLFFCNSSYAGNGDGLVRNIFVNPNGVITFKIDNHSDVPTCGSQPHMKNDYAFDGNTNTGKSQLALLLTAATARKSINVIGEGNCNVWPDRETVQYIYLSY